MAEKTWTITLPDGTSIANLERNGDCFISEAELPEDIDSLLTEVTASAEGETESVWTNAELINCAGTDGRHWFAFRELGAAELAQLQTQSQIEYLALMSDIDLEEM